MKKLMIMILLIITAIFATVQVTYATQTVSTEISDDLSWTYLTLGGNHAVRSNRFLIDFSEVGMEFNTTLGSWTNFIVPTVNGYTSRVDIYSTPTFNTPYRSYHIAYEAPGVTEVMFLYANSTEIFDINVSDVVGKYMQITLMLNPNPQPGLITNVEYFLNNYRAMYDFNINVYHEYNPATTIADLPMTAGNPNQEPSERGKIGEVYDYAYDPIGNTFSATVRYFQDYQLVIPNVGFGDDSFLEKVKSIDYYTIENEKFFMFNFIDGEKVYLSSTDQYASQWNGYAVWNLTTNELVVTNRALALTYLDITENRDIFAYLYLPNIPIDDLISVSGSYYYRFGYKNFWGQQKYYDWEPGVFALEKDEASYGATSVFQGALPQWSYDLLKYSSASLGVGAMIISKIPELSNLSFWVNHVGLGSLFTYAGAVTKVATGTTAEIESVTPDTVLRGKLNDHYTQAAGTLTVLPSNAKVSKLYLGSFTAYNTNVVDIDDSEGRFVYTEITWVTNGQVYTISEPFIDSEAILDTEDRDALPPEYVAPPFNFESWWKGLENTVKVIIIIAAAVLAFVILPKLDTGLGSAVNIIRNPRKIILLVVIILIVLLAIGVIII